MPKQAKKFAPIHPRAPRGLWRDVDLAISSKNSANLEKKGPDHLFSLVMKVCRFAIFQEINLKFCMYLRWTPKKILVTQNFFFGEKCYLIKVPKTSGHFIIRNIDSTHFSKNVGYDHGQLLC